MSDVYSVLFVCLGNICRSPMAHGVFHDKAKDAGLTVVVDSAGTGDWHVGNPPDPRACNTAAGRGHDIIDLRARQLCRADFAEFDLIVAMDRSNLRALEEMRPAGARARLQLFCHPQSADVPDPYLDGGFARVLDMIEQGADALITEIMRKGRA